MNFTIDKPKRACYCRICNKDFKRDEGRLVRFYSRSRRGGNDFICFSCVREMYHAVLRNNTGE